MGRLSVRSPGFYPRPVHVGFVVDKVALGKRYGQKMLQLFGGLGTLSYVRISRLNWVGLVNRMGSNSIS